MTFLEKEIMRVISCHKYNVDENFMHYVPNMKYMLLWHGIHHLHTKNAAHWLDWNSRVKMIASSSVEVPVWLWPSLWLLPSASLKNGTCLGGLSSSMQHRCSYQINIWFWFDFPLFFFNSIGTMALAMASCWNGLLRYIFHKYLVQWLRFI